MRAAERRMESDGFDKLTVDGIVSEVGTTRQTFYRRYRSISLLALEILLDRFGGQEEVNTGSLAADLLELLRTDVAMMTSPLIRKNLPGLLEDIRTNEEVRVLYLERMILPRRDVVHEVLARAQARGEIHREDFDAEYICDLMFGPTLSRVLLQTDAPIDDRLARQIVGSVLRELT
ncbi:MAG: TetR/AcrR family transcriptional regulator C-terminal ligand-binding domain-containing protein [Brevibacterium aurantiacum]